jgi:phosphohistidine phosphatase
MKTLYLVRHAKSSWSDSSLRDFDRPLNERGKHDAPFMGKLLNEKKCKPDLFLASPAKRAYSTAKKIAKEMGVDKSAIVTNAQLYHADESLLLYVVQSQINAIQSLMLFGHNPGLTEFAALLSHHEFENIPTCGVVCIDFLADSWREVKFNTGTLRFFEYPKKYKKD